MFKALAVSLTSGDFTEFKCSQVGCKGELIVRPEVASRLEGYAPDFAIIYEDTFNGVATPDETHETELDGTYDRFNHIVVHWRNDGFIDFVAFDSVGAAEREMSDITSVFA
jgi:hypothetical protein